MTSKSVSILFIITVSSVILATASLKLNRGYATNTEEGAVFADLLNKIDKVSRVIVTDKNRETVVTRGAQGNWVVAAGDDYPANLSKVQKSILQVAQLHYVEKKTANKNRYDRLDLGEIGRKDSQTRRIRLLDNKGQEMADLFVGKKRYNLAGLISEGAYIRRPSNKQVWLVRGEIDFEAKLTSWLRNSILNIREEDVLKAEIYHPDGEIVRISKTNINDRNFTLHDIPEGKKLRYDSDPNNIANVPENLEMLDVRKSEKINFSPGKTYTANFISRNGLEVKLFLIRVGEDDWLKLEITEKSNGSVPRESGKETAAQIAERVTNWTKGWAFKIQGFKAERLRRGAAEMLVDKKEKS